MRISRNQMVTAIFGIAFAAYGYTKLTEAVGPFWTKVLFALVIGVGGFFIGRWIKNTFRR